MQTRHQNRFLYFNELATTSKNYFIPYIQQKFPIKPGINVLEIGCGDGGNLLPFSQMGCRTTGIDISINRIEDAKVFFQEMKAEGRFIASDIFNWKEPEQTFDLIICHDVLEHIGDKKRFLSQLSTYLHPNGMLFMSFPAWQMPFGGHQQICTNKIVSHLPFIHLLPIPLYRRLLHFFGETERCIHELLEIKQTGISIEAFEKLIEPSPFTMINCQLWLINPHYEIKFSIHPCKLNPLFSRIPYIRNFLSTSCFYLLKISSNQKEIN